MRLKISDSFQWPDYKYQRRMQFCHWDRSSFKFQRIRHQFYWNIFSHQSYETAQLERSWWSNNHQWEGKNIKSWRSYCLHQLQCLKRLLWVLLLSTHCLYKRWILFISSFLHWFCSFRSQPSTVKFTKIKWLEFNERKIFKWED